MFEKQGFNIFVLKEAYNSAQKTPKNGKNSERYIVDLRNQS